MRCITGRFGTQPISETLLHCLVVILLFDLLWESLNGNELNVLGNLDLSDIYQHVHTSRKEISMTETLWSTCLEFLLRFVQRELLHFNWAKMIYTQNVLYCFIDFTDLCPSPCPSICPSYSLPVPHPSLSSSLSPSLFCPSLPVPFSVPPSLS